MSNDEYNIMDNLRRLENDQNRLAEIKKLEAMLSDAKEKVHR